MSTDQQILDLLAETEIELRRIDARGKAIVQSINRELAAILQRIEPEINALRKRQQEIRIRLGNLRRSKANRGGKQADAAEPVPESAK